MFRRCNNRVCRLIAYDKLNKSLTSSCPHEPIAFKKGKESSNILEGAVEPLHQNTVLEF